MTPNEQEVLTLLASNVRLFSAWQLARTWWTPNEGGLRRVKERLQRLERRDWMVTSDVLARPVVGATRPVCRWKHGESKPDFMSLAKLLHRRARSSPSMATVCVASAKTRSLFGAGGSPFRIRLTQVTHDLHVSEILLSYRSLAFDVRRFWLSEDRLPETWCVRERPDALLIRSDGSFLRAIEYGGDYTVERLESLHHAFSALPIPYEIW